MWNDSRLWEEAWPVADESQLQRETFELVVQVNGKVRDRIRVPAGLSDKELVARAKASEKVQVLLNGKVRDRFEVDVDLPEEELVARATASPRVQAHIDGAKVRKTIVVPRKLVNFVVG